MFYCPLHNWYSSEEPCKACHPVIIVTTSNMVFNEEEKETEVLYYNIHDNSDAFHFWLEKKGIEHKNNGHFTAIPEKYNIFQLGMEFGVYKKENETVKNVRNINP